MKNEDEEQDQPQARVVDVDGVQVDVFGDIPDEAVRKWMEQIEREDAEAEGK